MGVSTDGDVEKEATTDHRETSTEDRRLSKAGHERRVTARS
ncbi:hypothetical protein QRT08_16550 [Halalkalicoccus sp. NIPERK01]|nr:hypothetical protein [Halalkalicoccus sp. NIPERK01]